MSEPKLISPMLDNFAMGDPISDHNGVRCCPAMRNNTDERYIVKIISVPSSQTQLDALLLTGAYPDAESALTYFKTLADEIVEEVSTLEKLSSLEGFLPYEDVQIVPKDDETGYDIYLLSPYQRTLSRQFVRQPMTHLSAINLGLDLCAALSACRRSGYLCVDLKPNNIYVTAENEFRIGDIGFVRLDGLKYASLPDKYRSAYTAPEVADAFSSINDKIDMYALGLILYQAYNNGELPFTGDMAPNEPFTPPIYADYEMSEIILKACAPNPEDRWQDPVEMGQALVSYMQRNGAENTPIVPPAPVIEETPAEESVEEIPEEISEEIPGSEQPAEAQETADETSTYREDSIENLSFLETLEVDESDLEQPADEIAYETLTDEVSEILSQADELAELDVPDPVVAPEPVEIVIPEPVVSEPEESDADETTDEENDDEAESATSEDIAVDEESESEEFEDDEDYEDDEDSDPDVAVVVKKKSSRKWLRICIPILILMALLAGGVYYYINYYLQPVESVVVNGSEDNLTVYVSSLIDESKLTVVCSDAYGNQITAPVSDGKAVFTNLIPDTGYNVYVMIDGFHKLTGQTSASYSTPVQTTIVQFNAVTGAEDGSVILSFTVDGKDAEDWTVIYSAPGEPEESVTFPAHTVTLTGLTVGKDYTFTLVTDADLYLTGIEQITYNASALVFAEELTVNSCMDNALTVSWKAPEGQNIENWTVRCYNTNYNETIITTETTAVFENLNHADSFTVEVVAAGMSVSQRVYVPENSVTVTDLSADSVDTTSIKLSWNTSTYIPDSGWVLHYQVEGTDITSTITCKENNAKISPVIPGATYLISLQDANGNALLSGTIECTIPDAENFSGTFSSLNVKRSDLVFSMCKTPAKSGWKQKDVRKTDYTSDFTIGQKASFVLRISTYYKSDNSNVAITYVIRDAEGNPVSIASQTYTWTQMWNKYYCCLDVPSLPDATGTYVIEVYFNGMLAYEQPFTMSA